MSDATLEIGFLTIALPSVSCRNCSLMHDLAGVLDVEFNHRALGVFTEAWRAEGHRRKLSVDHEADFVCMEGGRDAILEAAVLIHRLAGQEISADEVENARTRLKAHKRPKPKPWCLGDVFAVPLSDGSNAFGQVLWSPAEVKAPTCALFEHRAPEANADLEEVLTSRTLSITHESSEPLDAGRWSVIGRHDVIDDPFGGPCSKPGEVGAIHSNTLESLAHAWWGLFPWNSWYKANYLDFYLLEGIERSTHAVLLSPSQLEAEEQRRSERASLLAPTNRTAR